MRLAGKTALVTGASRGNGRAIAVGLAREGADVAVNFRDHESEARSAADEMRGLGRNSIAVQADTSNAAQVNSMVQTVIDRFGRIDILVNNAGVLKRTPFLEITEAEWDWMLGINLKGCFLVGQAVAKEMVKRRSGTIVNVSSIGRRVAALGSTHYNTSKAGVYQLSRQMALELAEYGIRVNTISPGLIETDMNRKDIARAEFREARLARIPLRLIGTPEDLVGAVVYLASEEARLVTGSEIFIDGGVTVF